METETEPTNRVRKWRLLRPSLPELLRHPLFVVAFAGVVAFAVGSRLENRHLARQTRGYFSYHVMRLAGGQLFWLRAYISRTEIGLGKDDLDFAWNRYTEAKEAWATEVAPLFGRYYPDGERRKEFDDKIQPALLALHREMANLRYAKNPINLSQLKSDTDGLAVLVDRFVVNLDVEFPR